MAAHLPYEVSPSSHFNELDTEAISPCRAEQEEIHLYRVWNSAPSVGGDTPTHTATDIRV